MYFINRAQAEIKLYIQAINKIIALRTGVLE